MYARQSILLACWLALLVAAASRAANDPKAVGEGLLEYRGQEKAGAVLTIGFSRLAFGPCEQIWVSVTVTNVSEVEIECGPTGLDWSDRFEVLDVTDKPAPLTTFGQFYSVMDTAGSHVLHRAKPGASYREWSLLNRTFDLTFGGKFTVVGKRNVHNMGTGERAMIYSGKATIEVQHQVLPPGTGTRKPEQK
jgi:hypothetical protein